MAVLLLAPIALLPKHASGVHQWPAWVLTLIALPVQAFVHHPFIRNEPLLQRMR
jgi:cytochrome b561